MILEQFPLDFLWPTQEPFLFCAHHLDFYPKGNEQLAPPPAALQGRSLGQDFEVKDGFRMYHGKTVPGFPVHPHRGFETVTLVRQGFVDHADSMGAAGRYGQGDVQWMTAGRGVQHSEMFPLLCKTDGNPAELFQLWLNLPRERKMGAPDFKMFWSETIPVIEFPETKARVTLVAGELGEVRSPHAPRPPAASWASDPSSCTLIWLLEIEAGGSFTIPGVDSSGVAASQGLSATSIGRSLYFYEGHEITVAGETMMKRSGAHLQSRRPCPITAHEKAARLLILQSKKIGEPIAQHGPFVMNTRDEIKQAIDDYQSTQFGGWPWDRTDMVHGPEMRRFAKYPDGRVEYPT